ncbi:MAG: transglutaminase domain-containing protein [Pseudomonadales bacterium]|nr:transglutaminase domain-containing protein [Pseudomonadales bacterium]
MNGNSEGANHGMNTSGLLGLSLLLWGFNTDQWLFAIPMALMMELRHAWPRRWDLTRQDFYRVADLTAIGLTGTIVFLTVNAREYHFVTTLVQWLPIIFFPLTVVIAYSTTVRMPLDVLFYSLRRQKHPVTQSWNMNTLLFGLALLSAGTNPRTILWYFPVAAMLVLLAFWRGRPGRYPIPVLVLTASLIFLTANITGTALHKLHQAAKYRAQQWLSEFILQRTDPTRSRTAMGSVGKLKLSDRILFRVKVDSDGLPPRLLQEASYDLPSDNEWLILSSDFQEIAHSDDFEWQFGESAEPISRLTVYREFTTDTALVPVPQNLTVIADLPAQNLRMNQFGAVQALGLVPSPLYRLGAGLGSINGAPGALDLHIPTEFAETINSFASPFLAESNRDPSVLLNEMFANFSYSLWQPEQTLAPLAGFLLDTRAGHCEYFATATVLLLRKMGIPARYAVGYAISEYDADLDMYLVRQRHAHAWALGYIAGRWQVFDTTPDIWFQAEAETSGPVTLLTDYISNRLFEFQLWWAGLQEEDYEIWLYIAGAILLAILIWRLTTSEQVDIRNGSADISLRDKLQGQDSPYFAIEAALEAAGFQRPQHEAPQQWITRMAFSELSELVKLHYRYRFSSPGLTKAEFDKLAEDAAQLLARYEQDHKFAIQEKDQ